MTDNSTDEKKQYQLSASPILITGGHMTPALAVKSKLEEQGVDKFIWVGHKYNQAGATTASPEFETIARMPNTRFINLPAGKLVRNWYSGLDQFGLAVYNILKIPYGFLVGLIVMLRHRPQVVLSFGGYLAVPLVIWAKVLQVPTITHEQTVVTGKANSLLAKIADKVLVSWPESQKYYNRETILTGNPLRPEIFEYETISEANASHWLHRLNTDLPTIYVTGGNQGALIINKVLFRALPDLLKRANIIHQTGSAPETQRLVTNLNLAEDYAGTYYPQPYFYSEEIGTVFNQSQLIVSRSGANTVSEVLALGIPSIFIPIPWVTQDEQTKNAQFAVEQGIAKLLTQSELNVQSLVKAVLTELDHINKGLAPNQMPLKSTAEKAKQVVPQQAADKITHEVLDLCSNES